MKREQVVQILNEHKKEIKERFGVKSLILFGSVAREESTPASDIDLLVEFNQPAGYFKLFELQDYLEWMLGCPVDIGTPNSLKPSIRYRIQGKMLRVF